MNKQKRIEPIWCEMFRDKFIKPKQKKRITEQKGRTKESQSGFYTLKAWIQIRDKRRIENPLCQECERKGKIVPMYAVDHINPIDLYPELALVYSNTQSLCYRCNTIDKPNKDKQLRKIKSGQDIMKQLEMGGG